MAEVTITREVNIVEGIDEAQVDDALRLTYDAFAKKFHIGFRDAGDFLRLFRDAVDTTSCLSAIVDGQLLGILTFQTTDREFFHPRLAALFTRFSPLRALRVMINLLLLDDRPKADEFVVSSLAVSPSSRGLGLGTALMRKAEEKARSMGKQTMTLAVIGENEGAIRLYERLGYQTIRSSRGILVWLAIKSAEVRYMRKPLPDEAHDWHDSASAADAGARETPDLAESARISSSDGTI